MHDPANTSTSSPWALTVERAAKQFETDSQHGLSSEEAALRFERHGPNAIRRGARRGHLKIFLSQFVDLMIGLLAAAAIVSALVGDWKDAILIAAIVLANALIGFVQENRAEAAVEALKRLAEPLTRVRRDGQVKEVPAVELVPGDVIVVAGGSVVGADCRIVHSIDLQADESPLTGESLPVDKSAHEVASGTPLPERSAMLHAGTHVSLGKAEAVVTATGMSTQLGHIAALLEAAERVKTPLQLRLAKLSKQLAIAVVAICLVVFLAGVLRGNELSMMLLLAVSLAVAAVPEGLPAVHYRVVGSGIAADVAAAGDCASTRGRGDTRFSQRDL